MTLWESHHGSAGLYRKYSFLTSCHHISEKKFPRRRRPLVFGCCTGSLVLQDWKVSQVIWTNDVKCVVTRLFQGGELGGTSDNLAVPDCGCCVHKGGVHFHRGRFQSGVLCDSLTMSKGPWVQKEKVGEGTEIQFCGSWDFLPALTQLSLTPSLSQVVQVRFIAECLVENKMAPGCWW